MYTSDQPKAHPAEYRHTANPNLTAMTAREAEALMKAQTKLGPTVVEATPVSPVANLVMMLESTQADVRAQLSQLAHRLNPVLRADYPLTDGLNATSPGDESELEMQLRHLNEAAMSHAAAIQQLLDRLTI